MSTTDTEQRATGTRERVERLEATMTDLRNELSDLVALDVYRDASTDGTDVGRDVAKLRMLVTEARQDILEALRHFVDLENVPERDRTGEEILRRQLARVGGLLLEAGELSGRIVTEGSQDTTEVDA
jgi:uncharacterized protein (UPF0335 family)